ncbi:MAG: DNA polymerase III [Spirochaetaceae bacterium]|jgi:DNA polymerase-3 subunit gamma/tau|nr:DNA polymerase III [Spirochaetaceae bacterium]
MFENIIGQSAVEALKRDFTQGQLPPSILFWGPEASAKGTAALELARALSCEAEGAWNCSCPSCILHRTLSHPDVLLLGPRSFQAEIASAAPVFLADSENNAARYLFLRAVRKLLARFSPVLWEGDAKISKLNKHLETISDCLEELAANKKLEKLCEKIIGACTELESEGVALMIPASQIRHGSYWLRMAPNGNRKVMIIENADKMNDTARNSLLKILEEPPERAAIILTTARPKALLPTILSRLRPYYFTRRSAGDEAAVLKRIFRQEHEFPRESLRRDENMIQSFQNNFLPVPAKSLYPPAAYFWSSLAARAISRAREERKADPAGTLVAIGKYCAPRAGAGGLPAHDMSVKAISAIIMKAAAQFEPRSLFSQFIGLLYELLGEALNGAAGAAELRCRDDFRHFAEEARTAVEVYHQTPVLALECLIEQLTRAYSLL